MQGLETKFDKHKKIWSGGKTQPFYDVNCSIGRIMFNNLKCYPKNVCEINAIDDKKVTNGELVTLGVRIAQCFKKQRLNHEDVIGIVARNTPNLSPVALGCFLNCSPFHAVNPSLDLNTLTHIFGLTKPKIIFCDGADYDKILAATKVFKPLIYTVTDHREGVPKVTDLLEPTKTEFFYQPESLTFGGDQTVAILCSSGTTGLPKAVCLSNHTMMFDMPLTSEEVVFNFSGLDWVTGLMVYALCAIKGSTRIITNKPYTPEYFVELVQKYKINFTVLPPRYISTLINCPAATAESLQSIQCLTSGGGCISLPTLQRMQKLLKNGVINFGYGFTEGGGVSGAIGLDAGTSVGKLIPGVQVRIVDDNNRNLGYNETGEILVYHGHTWNGYYGNPMETIRMQDSLGWFHTGDLGYFDENNLLYVVDRKKDILKYMGMHYWPQEIEDAISEMPEVAEVCVVGITDEKCGDPAGALIVRMRGATLQENDVKDYVAKRLPVPHKQLHAGVRFVDALPQNANGKTLRREAKALFVQRKD